MLVTKELPPTLSQHLLMETNRFLWYPARVPRTRNMLVLQQKVTKGLRRLVEWRKTFAPKRDEKGADLLADSTLLDELYCRNLLEQVPEMVRRSQTLKALVLSNVSHGDVLVLLREAANCYISGLPQATVALSRAAVEYRIRHAGAKLFGKAAVDEIRFDKLIDRLSPRVLPKECRDLADAVRLAGNDVLHDEPTDSNAALRVFENARRVVQILDGG